jgi:hypothetical protein
VQNRVGAAESVVLCFLSADLAKRNIVKGTDAMANQVVYALMELMHVTPSRHLHGARVTGPCADVNADG